MRLDAAYIKNNEKKKKERNDYASSTICNISILDVPFYACERKNDRVSERRYFSLRVTI